FGRDFVLLGSLGLGGELGLLAAAEPQAGARGLLLGLVLRGEVDELQERHLGGVAGPGPDTDDPRLTPGPPREARSDLGEQLVDDLLRAQVRHRLTPRVQITAASESDHLLRE